MHTEIEAKLKVESFQQVIEKLKELGGQFAGEQVQKDCYFDDAKRTLTESDRGLRLRRHCAGGDEKNILTYKGAKEVGKFKQRQEIETEVKDGDSMEGLLLALGFEKAIFFEKKRQVWYFGGCEVALDELPMLGEFVEIEGPDEEKIVEVMNNLELTGFDPIKESYAHLMNEKLRELKKSGVKDETR